ncbi:hypothetical protein SSS_07710, partial [Sarcoptes scabiei]
RDFKVNRRQTFFFLSHQNSNLFSFDQIHSFSFILCFGKFFKQFYSIILDVRFDFLDPIDFECCRIRYLSGSRCKNMRFEKRTTNDPEKKIFQKNFFFCLIPSVSEVLILVFVI